MLWSMPVGNGEGKAELVLMAGKTIFKPKAKYLVFKLVVLPEHGTLSYNANKRMGNPDLTYYYLL